MKQSSLAIAILFLLVAGCIFIGPVDPPEPPSPDPVIPDVVLVDSGPVTSQRDGEIIERLRIVSDGDGITIRHDGVTVKLVEVHHRNGHGIRVQGSRATTISDVYISHAGAPETGANESECNNIHVVASPETLIETAYLEKGSSGVWLVDSPNSTVREVHGFDFRGPFPRGQLVQFDKSDDSLLEDFSNVNPLETSWVEDNVSVYQSDRCTIRRGIIDGNNDKTGVGVMLEFADECVVEDVDTIRQGNGSFSSYPGTNNVFRRCRAMDNYCGPTAKGDGPPTSGSLIFASSPEAQGTVFTECAYWNACNPNNILWNRSTVTTADIREQEFEPQPIQVIDLPWRKDER